VARQKRELQQKLIRTWTDGHRVEALLKTDLFEEAYGQDQILFDLFPKARLTMGMDINQDTVRRAALLCPLGTGRFFVADVRQVALRPDTIDLVVSNSTLDHFNSREDLMVALRGLFCILKPGGLLFITMDNPRNPIYYPLRWVSRWLAKPLRLGYTTSQANLARILECAGFEVVTQVGLIHNPRIISTLLFLMLRCLLGRHAEGPIRVLLRVFSCLGNLPSAEFTACFVAACARKTSN